MYTFSAIKSLQAAYEASAAGEEIFVPLNKREKRILKSTSTKVVKAISAGAAAFLVVGGAVCADLVISCYVANLLVDLSFGPTDFTVPALKLSLFLGGVSGLSAGPRMAASLYCDLKGASELMLSLGEKRPSRETPWLLEALDPQDERLVRPDPKEVTAVRQALNR